MYGITAQQKSISNYQTNSEFLLVFRLGEDLVTCLEIFLVHLNGINVPVLVEGDWSPVGYQRWWIVRGSSLEHPGTVENVHTGSHGAPEMRIFVWFSPRIFHNPTCPGACRQDRRESGSGRLRTGLFWRQQTW